MLNNVLLFIGTSEILVIGGVALLIFGGKKLPELMRSMGKGVKEFKNGMAEGAEAFKEEVNNQIDTNLNSNNKENITHNNE